MRVNRALDGAIAAFLLAAGIALIITSCVWSVPARSELHEVTGQLTSYDVRHYSGRFGPSKTWYAVVFRTADGGTFYTEALKDQVAHQAFSRRGAALRFFVTSPARHVNADGAQPAYGLWVDGTEIQSLEATVGHERAMVRLGFPAIGCVLILLGAYQVWRSARPEHHEVT